MKRLVYIFLAQIFLCVSVSSAECPAVPTITVSPDNEGAMYITENRSSSPYSNSLDYHYYSSNEIVDFGEFRLSGGTVGSRWYDWKNGDGEVISRTLLSSIGTTGIISVRGTVYDCNESLIGSFHQSISFDLDSTKYRASLSIYNSDGVRVVKGGCNVTVVIDGLTDLSDHCSYTFNHEDGVVFSVATRRYSFGSRLLSFGSNHDAVDMRLILAAASLYY